MNGQEKIEFLLNACKKSNSSFPHLLLITEDPAIIKETAKRISVKLNVSCSTLNLNVETTIGDIANALTNLKENDILIIPDIHRISKEISQILHYAMTKYIIDLLIDEPNSRLLQLKLNRFSVIASAPHFSVKFLNMFLSVIDGRELITIAHEYVIKIMKSFNLVTTNDVADKMIKFANQNSLELESILKNFSKFLNLSDNLKKTITTEHFESYLKFSGITENVNNNSRNISSEVKREVWKRDEGVCVICKRNENLEYDHIIPFSRGGSNTARNIQLLCELCNRTKGANIH